MKKFFLLMSAAAALFAACSEYDDSALKQDIADLASRVATVEASVNQLKTDCNALSTAVDALKNNLYVANVSQTANGWDLLLSDGRTIDIDNSKTAAGDVLGVRKDTDGKWYWTLNGEFLLLDFKKVPVNADSGVVDIKIENSGLYVKLAGQADWQLVGAVGSSVTPAVSDVKEEGGNVVIYLTAGGSISIPKLAPLSLSISGPSSMKEGESAEFSYTVTGNDSNTEVVALAQGNWTAVLTGTKASGSISVTAPAVWEDGTVVVLASNTNLVVMKVIHIAQGVDDPAIEIIANNVLEVPEAGGVYNIPVIANFEPVVVNGSDWIEVVEVKSNYAYTLTVAANTADARSADVVFKNAEGTASETVKVNQEAHAKAWTLLSKWPIQSTANKSYYSSAWKAHSPEYGEMPHETQGTIIFDHRASVAAGTTSDKNNALDVPTSSSAFKPHDPRAYGTWDGDFWNLESLQGASAGEKIRVFFELAGSANTMGYWKMEYLDGSEWKIAGPSHTVSYKGSDVTYTHRMYDQSDTEHASGGNAGFIPFEAEATLTADVEKVTFRLTAVTTYCTDGVTARTAVSEGGEGTSGWIMLVASAPEGGTAADHHPHIEVFR